MSRPAGWNARAALAPIRRTSWIGHAWRFHRRRYDATDSTGSRTVSGRYHRASDQFPDDQVCAALYLALSPEVSVGEVLRHFDQLTPQLNEYRLSELGAELGTVLDCRDASALGLTAADLIRDGDFLITQDIAAEAIVRGAEGVLVPSATRMGDNLVLFPDQSAGTSRLMVIGSRDPRLYISH